MSVFSKQANQRVTNRLAQPTRYVTQLDIDQLLEIVSGVVDQTATKSEFLRGGEKLWLDGSGPGALNIHFGLASAKDPSKVVPIWSTQLALKASSSGSATLVTVSLAKWKTRDGLLLGKREFERFLTDLEAEVAAQDPSYSVLDGSFFRH